MRTGDVLDEIGLAEPLVIGAMFVLGHGGQRVQFIGNAAKGREFRNKVSEAEKRSAPGFNKHDASLFSQHALHF